MKFNTNLHWNSIQIFIDIKNLHLIWMKKLISWNLKIVWSKVNDFWFDLFGLQIFDINGAQVGHITRKLKYVQLEEQNDFIINFPIDLDVRIKTVLLGACILIVITTFNFDLDFDFDKNSITESLESKVNTFYFLFAYLFMSILALNVLFKIIVSYSLL